MSRPAFRPLAALLGASLSVVMLAACSTGGESKNNAPAGNETQAQESTSPEQWMKDNCPSKVVKVDSSAVSVKNAPAYALTMGPVSAPATSDSEEAIRLYSYDEVSNTFTAIRTVDRGETFCFNADAETKTGRSEPNDTDAEFATVASAEHPDGVWIDSVPRAVPLDESGNPLTEGRSLKPEYYWSTKQVDASTLEAATETIEYCSIMACA